MSVPQEVISQTSMLEIPQQYLAGEAIDADVEFKLGRACMAHCVVAAQELIGSQKTSIPEFINFVLENGPGTGSDLYMDGRGWSAIALADLMRLRGLPVVSQNFLYDKEQLDIRAAVTSGRVRSDYEKSRLVLASSFGGRDRSEWVQAMQNTLEFGGLVVATIKIPLLSSNGSGGHSVVVTEIDTNEGWLTYFDPDYYNLQRYGSQTPNIERTDETALMYRRSIGDHLGVMTGEVMHVFKP